MVQTKMLLSDNAIRKFSYPTIAFLFRIQMSNALHW